MKTESFKLFEDDSLEKKASVRRGPPNRMNDLSYSDWMKFQKSFFRHTTFSNLVRDCVLFFTKAVWPDGNASKSLVVGFEHVAELNGIRQVEYIASTNPNNIRTTIHQKSDKYDFILVNLRNILQTENQLADFLKISEGFYSSLREAILPGRYCGVVVGMPSGSNVAFPIPWSVALAARNQFRLRDEKIGLIEESQQTYYCIFLQAQQDERKAVYFGPDSIELVKDALEVPQWIIPKPPPRKKNEMLHPAKFPETLVSEFIDIFTKEGDTVFDPMSGTGSALLAAVRSRRNAVGLELIQDFVDIAKKRLEEEYPAALFEEMRPGAWWKILQGDATKLHGIQKLSGLKFQYCVTSPPYWSMLTNRGSEGQESRRQKNLRLTYSDDMRDLGNIRDYDKFLDVLTHVYYDVADKLTSGGYLTVIVKNVKRNHVVYPIAIDLVRCLASADAPYQFAGATLWCQDDVKVKPFAVGIYWVSNTLHQYCLHFKKRE